MKQMFAAIMMSLFALSAHAQCPPKADLVETAISAGQFNTLVAAVDAAGLVPTLKGPGPFTVLAPTDAAFAKLPAGTIDALLADIPTLTKILTYHVIPGEFSAKNLAKLGKVMTVQGQEVEITVRGGKLFLNDSEVVMSNIKTSNGIIQVIDTVLLPK
jgi:uncharacterized surface protein with fasciclin (FAS1) repeats